MWYEQPDTVTEGLKLLARQLFVPHVRRLGWEFSAQSTHGETLLRSVRPPP